MKNVYKALLLITCYVTNVQAVEIYFSPSPDCENHIVAAINNSEKEIDASVYSINNPKIMRALIAANKRGVNVRILTDRTQAGGKSSGVLALLNAGINLRVHSKHKIEHNKFGVFDGKLAINGSYNWTQPATEVNSENCAVMPEQNAVQAYQVHFEELWLINTEAASRKAIAKIEGKQARRLAETE